MFQVSSVNCQDDKMTYYSVDHYNNTISREVFETKKKSTIMKNEMFFVCIWYSYSYSKTDCKNNIDNSLIH